MTKRKLNDAEIKLCNQSIERIKEENLDLEFTTEYYKLMIDKGMDREFRAKKLKMQKDYKDSLANLQSNKNQIEILNDQIKNGVEKKESVKVEKNEEPARYVG